MLNYKLWGFEASVMAFIAVVFLLLNGNTEVFDSNYGLLIQSFRGPGLNTLTELVTYIGNWQTITIICILLVAFEKTRKKYGLPVTAVAILSSVANKIIKVLVARQRPDAANMLIEQGGYSFPSGHTTTAFAVFLLLAYIVYKEVKDPKKKIPGMIGLILLPIVIGLSRVYLGVHYASDVFAGMWLGIAAFCLVGMFVYPYKREKEKWKEAQRKKEEAKRAKLETLEVEVVDSMEDVKKG